MLFALEQSYSIKCCVLCKICVRAPWEKINKNTFPKRYVSIKDFNNKKNKNIIVELPECLMSMMMTTTR